MASEFNTARRTPEPARRPAGRCARFVLLAGLLGSLSACVTQGYRSYDPRYEGAEEADLSWEIEGLASDLASEADRRTSLGSVRVVIDKLVPLESRRARYRAAANRDRTADLDTEATLRHELEMALAHHMNVVGGTVISGSVEEDLGTRADRAGATHELRGTFQRRGRIVEVSLQLLDRRNDWLVATARREIVGFEAGVFDRAVVDSTGLRAQRAESAETADLAPESPSLDVSAVDGGVPANPPDGSAAADAPPEFTSESEIRFDVGPAAARLRALDPRLVEDPAPADMPVQAEGDGQ